MIQIREAKRLSYKLLAVALLLSLSWAAVFAFKLNVSAATTVINVTTTVDEDSHPDVGAGCSLYEAVIAANTAASYGGCTAGDAEGPNIVTLPAGTYARDDVEGPLADEEYPDNIMLVLDGASLAGAGMDETVIDGYNLNLVGDQITTVSNVSVHTSDSSGPPTYIYISGSNKTISGVSVSHAGMTPAVITFQAEEEQVIENVTIENSEIRAELFATNPAATMSCYTGSCRDITIDNLDMKSNFSSTINLPGENVSFINSSIDTIGCSGSATLNLGPNSRVENISMGTEDCSNAIIIDLDTSTHSVDGITAYGNSVFLDVDSPELTNLNLNADISTFSNVSVANLYDGSSFSNVVISSAGYVEVGLFGELMASSVDQVEIISHAALTFENMRDNAIINDTYFEANEGSYPVINLDLNGNDVAIDGMEVIMKDPSSYGSLHINGDSASIRNINFVDSSIYLDEPGTYLIENFSIDAPDFLEAIFSDEGGEITVRDGYIYNGRGGVSAESYSESPGYKLTVENVMFENMGGVYEESPGIIFTVGVEEVTIRDVTIVDAAPENVAPITINGGSNHELTNITIVDSNAGVAILEYGPSVTGTTDVLMNNITIRNNESHPVRESLPDETALFISNENANVTIMNSTLSGASDHTACFVDSVGSLTVNYSYSDNTTCVDEGFTLLVDAGLSAELADNDSEGTEIGFEGSYGVLKTLALEGDSALIGAGDADTCEVTDARGFERDLGVGCDVGAFQYNIVASDVDPGDGEGENPGDGGGQGDEDDDSSGNDNNNDDDNDNKNDNDGSQGGSEGVIVGVNDPEVDDGAPTSSDDSQVDESDGAPATGANGSSPEVDDSSDDSKSDDSAAIVLIAGGSILGVGFLVFLGWLIFRSRP